MNSLILVFIVGLLVVDVLVFKYFFFIKGAIQRKRQRFRGESLRKVGGILQINQKQNDVLFFCCNLNGIVCEIFNVSVHFSERERRQKERRVGKNQIHVS